MLVVQNGKCRNLSKVMPFPTRAKGGLSSPRPLYSSSTNLGGSSEPLATLRKANIFFSSAQARSLKQETFAAVRNKSTFQDRILLSVCLYLFLISLALFYLMAANPTHTLFVHSSNSTPKEAWEGCPILWLLEATNAPIPKDSDPQLMTKFNQEPANQDASENQRNCISLAK